MKVVLIKEMQKLGAVGDTKEVKDGYARNFLIPRGLAARSGDLSAKSIIKKVLADKKRQEKELEKLRKFADTLADKLIIIKVGTSSTGKLFGSVTREQIAEKLSTKELEISDKMVETDPIKELGDYDIKVNFGKDVQSMIKLKIEGKSKK